MLVTVVVLRVGRVMRGCHRTRHLQQGGGQGEDGGGQELDSDRRR